MVPRKTLLVFCLALLQSAIAHAQAPVYGNEEPDAEIIVWSKDDIKQMKKDLAAFKCWQQIMESGETDEVFGGIRLELCMAKGSIWRVNPIRRIDRLRTLRDRLGARARSHPGRIILTERVCKINRELFDLETFVAFEEGRAEPNRADYRIDVGDSRYCVVEA